MKILEALHILDGLGPRVNRQVTNTIVNDIMQTLKQKGVKMYYLDKDESENESAANGGNGPKKGLD